MTATCGEETPMDIDTRTLRRAWAQLAGKGTASPTVAHLLKIGLEPFLDAFDRRFLGPDGLGEGFKLVLGMNGEGKTHLLYCLRERALERGHPVAFLEAASAGLLDSPFDFARALLRATEVPEGRDEGSDELRAVTLLRAAATRKAAEVEARGLDPADVIPAWADGLRGSNLQPHGLADALADGLEAALRADAPGLRAAAARLTFEEARLTKAQRQTEGSQLLRSLPLLIKLLGFRPLVVLVDEAESAIEKKGSARRREFLKMLRFLNDHVGHAASEGQGALIAIGCTDELWPEQFHDYEALRQRLSDVGRDTLEERAGMTPRAQARANKLWVRETFRGDEPDYVALGDALVELGSRVHAELAPAEQRQNGRRLARVASSTSVQRQVKRRFVKALVQLIEDQVEAGEQRVIEEQEAARLLDAAAAAIEEVDAEEDEVAARAPW